MFFFSLCLIIQDPAGIFELVEVVGNGTYGQVYKVGVSLHLFVSELKRRDRWKLERKRHYPCFSCCFFSIYWSTASLHFVLILSGLDYLWFSPSLRIHSFQRCPHHPSSPILLQREVPPSSSLLHTHLGYSLHTTALLHRHRSGQTHPCMTAFYHAGRLRTPLGGWAVFHCAFVHNIAQQAFCWSDSSLH